MKSHQFIEPVFNGIEDKLIYYIHKYSPDENCSFSDSLEKEIRHYQAQYDPKKSEEDISNVKMIQYLQSKCHTIDTILKKSIEYRLENVVGPTLHQRLLNYFKSLNIILYQNQKHLEAIGGTRNLELETFNSIVDKDFLTKEYTPIPGAKAIEKEIIDFIKVTSEIQNFAKNKYPQFFTNEGFLLFEHLISKVDNTPPPVTECSFIFREMIVDNLIYDRVTHTEYYDILSNYNIDIDQLKTRTIVSSKTRVDFYIIAKEKMHILPKRTFLDKEI